VTGVIDAGGGSQRYPEDYQVVEELHKEGLLTVRIAYNLFTQRPGHELEDFRDWVTRLAPDQGDDTYRHNGAGEMLVYSAADFEDFRAERPETGSAMPGELEAVIRVLARHRWPWRLHATYDETITRALDVFEKVDREIPLQGIPWFFDHAETISDRNIDRVAALGGGIAVQHRMAYQGEYFSQRYGAKAAQHSPPIRRMLGAGLKVGAGTDATRVASYNPWVSIAWLVTGRTLGGMQLYPAANRVDRIQALELWTSANTWFSGETGRKGQILAGQLADLAVLSADYLAIPEADIEGITSVLTLLGGAVVHGDGDFHSFAPGLPAPMPDWSPVRRFGGYAAPSRNPPNASWKAAGCGCSHRCNVHGHDHGAGWASPAPVDDPRAFWGALGCSCWAF